MSSYELTDNLINAAVNKSEERTKSKKESEKDELLNSDIEKYLKPVVFSTTPGKSVNESIVAYQLYNCFNYSLFVNNSKHKEMKYMIGVTSPNAGEGKTTTACNLATALSLIPTNRVFTKYLELQYHRVLQMLCSATKYVSHLPK